MDEGIGFPNTLLQAKIIQNVFILEDDVHGPLSGSIAPSAERQQLLSEILEGFSPVWFEDAGVSGMKKRIHGSLLHAVLFTPAAMVMLEDA
jgi:hypothetical protein